MDRSLTVAARSNGIEMTTIELPNSEWEKIRQHGSRDYPNECCGFLLGAETDGRKRVAEAWPAPNSRHDSPRNRFLITAEDWREGEKYSTEKKLDILGFYHSHPDHPARPSEYDREHAWPWMSYIILSVQQREPAAMTSWVLTEDRSKFEEETVEICQPKS
jgi:proteasome lid subunit RPN8/RPN11